MSAPGPYRLAQGGRIDRAQPIAFTFNGRPYRGYAGDTLASALLGAGVRTLARSFKFHRPRGLYSCGMEEPCGLLQLEDEARTVPAVRAPLQPLYPQLAARSHSGWPALGFDLGRILDFTAPLWSAGFYNKTFLWPSWHTYEGTIRRMAGVGRAPSARDPDRYLAGNLHCDVLVVGGGLAGLSAALAEARAGAVVILAEQDLEWGGAALWDTQVRDGQHEGVAGRLEGLRECANVRLLSGTTAVGCYEGTVVTLLERRAGTPGAVRERFWTVHAQRLVLATGCIEQPLVFANNDRPGILLAQSARQYLKRYGVACGRRVLIATNNDSAYALAAELRQAAVGVAGVSDSRAQPGADAARQLAQLGIAHFPGTMPVDSYGFAALKGVYLGRLSADGRSAAHCERIACDALAVSGGLSPALSLYAQAGGSLTFDATSGALQPRARLPLLEIVGSAAQAVPVGPRISPLGPASRQWVDLLHDVTVADLRLALQENYTSVEHVKRYTTVGMAPDQGKTSAAATLEVLARLRGVDAAALGHTTLRPPVMPVTLGAISGREIGAHFTPHRRVPLHDWHVGHGALLQEFGEWRRPVVYLRTGETRKQAVRREARGVRGTLGLFDGSSLGKIEMHGPDALAFLDRFYINDLTTLKPLRARYGLMLKETGVLFDDGTVTLLAPDRVLLSTTSGNAARVGQWLEEWHQCEWPQLRVAIIPVTDAWATLTLAGPDARATLARLAPTQDFSADAFRHLALRETTLLGMPARICRVSFTGELTYEISVPADQAGRLLAGLESAAGGDLMPFGLEALMLMRLEQGFLHLGADSDGTSIPDDVGWGKVAASKRADFIGKRSLRLPEHVRPDRLQFVGLRGSKPFVIGAHLRVADSQAVTDGWVTSAGLSVQSDEPIALAMVRAGRARVGQSVTLFDAGSPIGQAVIVKPPFYDPPPSAGQ